MKFVQFLLENTIGLIENITIDGVGTVQAKVDSGNDGYNVIDGQNIEFGRGSVEFMYGDTKIIKKVVEMIDVHIGDSKVEKRPVVLFDMVLQGKEYKDVKFSVANREMNDYKILICKDFVKASKLLIDVSKEA